MERVTCLFSGNVQGVGFRYTVMNISQSYDVVGYTRNLADGRVEVVVEGESSECNGMLHEIEQRMHDFVRKADRQTSPATGEFQRFGIRHQA